MAVDLRQVAEQAAVSMSTASRALAGSTRVSAGTRERVRAVADSLGYRPNATARALRTARSQLVGLVVTNLVNASFRAIAEVVQRQLSEAGLQMVLSVTGGEATEERRAVRMLLDHNAVGVIVVGSDLKATDELHQAGLSVVHLARRPASPVGDCVLGDDLTGAQNATRYLLDLGHRRIAVIAGPESVTSGRERMQGFRLAMEERRVPVRPHLLITGPFVSATGDAGVRALWRLPARQRPTALLVASHEAGHGALPALQELGVAIPDQLSVVCFEDSEQMRWWHPAVTVVDNNPEQMGEVASRMLLDRIAARHARPGAAARVDIRELRVGTRLVTRGSCAPPAHRLVDTRK